MKLLPVAVVMVLLATAVGVGMAPIVTDSGGEEQPDPEAFSPSYATASTAELENEQSSEQNVINVLSLPSDSIERSDVRRQYADLGPAAGFDTDGTTTQLVTRSLAADLEAADDSERQALLEEELEEIEDEVETLESEEQIAIGAFSNGELEPRELLVELAAIHQSAGTLEERIQVVDSYAETLEQTDSSDRLETLEYDLRMLKGPMRAHAVSVLRGERPATRVMIETGNGEIALSAIDDDVYIREINRKGLRGDGQNTLADDRAAELTEQQYPLLWNQSAEWNLDISTSESVFVMSVPFPGGELQTFLDGASEQTFIEHQKIPLGIVETGESTSKVQDGLNVTVDQTYAGGPLRVTVTDAENDEPVGATVTVGQEGQESQSVGTVDENGVVWAVSPREQFTITVLGEGTSAAFVDIDPPSPESVTGRE